MTTETSILFLDLGQDIIESEIIPLLSTEDIQQLKLTSKNLYQLVNNSPFVWQQLFKKTFGTTPTPFNKWGPELYKLRSKAEVYSWGSISGGRLGYAMKDVPKENISKFRFNTGVVRPTVIPGLEDEIIADVSAGGFSFQLLTSKGKIYTTGSSYHQGQHGDPGPDRNDYNQFQINNIMRRNHEINFFPPDVGRRGGVMNIIPTAGARPLPMPQTMTSASPFITPTDPNPSDDLKPSNKFLKREYATKDGVKFVSVSSGRSHFIALDNAGNLWSWDRSEFGVNIKFESKEPSTQGKDLVKDLGYKILKIAAGWNSSVAYLYNHGLVYWLKREPLQEYNNDALAHHKVIPDTWSNDFNSANRVVDFLPLDNTLIYVTQDGKLWKNDLNDTPSYPLTGFQDELNTQSQYHASKFTRLTGSFQSFAAFSNDDYVFIGSNTANSSRKPQVIPDLQQKKCVNVSFGDYHSLALLSDGTLLSWGVQSANCGCLGLGHNEEVVNSMGGIIVNNSDLTLRVETPTKVPLDERKKVLAIAAGGWQSSAIIA